MPSSVCTSLLWDFAPGATCWRCKCVQSGLRMENSDTIWVFGIFFRFLDVVDGFA